MCNSLQPHGLQHTRPPCPSLSPRVCSNSCPLSRWCYLTQRINSSSAAPCPFAFNLPQHHSFQMSQLFASGGQSTRASASASIFPMNIQDWFPLGLTGWISLQSKRLSRVFSSTIFCRHQLFGAQPFLSSSSHIHMWLLQKPYLWLYEPLLAT